MNIAFTGIWDSFAVNFLRQLGEHSEHRFIPVMPSHFVGVEKIENVRLFKQLDDRSHKNCLEDCQVCIFCAMSEPGDSHTQGIGNFEDMILASAQSIAKSASLRDCAMILLIRDYNAGSVSHKTYTFRFLNRLRSLLADIKSDLITVNCQIVAAFWDSLARGVIASSRSLKRIPWFGVGWQPPHIRPALPEHLLRVVIEAVEEEDFPKNVSVRGEDMTYDRFIALASDDLPLGRLAAGSDLSFLREFDKTGYQFANAVEMPFDAYGDAAYRQAFAHSFPYLSAPSEDKKLDKIGGATFRIVFEPQRDVEYIASLFIMWLTKYFSLSRDHAENGSSRIGLAWLPFVDISESADTYVSAEMILKLPVPYIRKEGLKIRFISSSSGKDAVLFAAIDNFPNFFPLRFYCRRILSKFADYLVHYGIAKRKA